MQLTVEASDCTYPDNSVTVADKGLRPSNATQISW